MLRRLNDWMEHRGNYALAVLGIVSGLGLFGAYREFHHLIERFPTASEEQRRFLLQIEINERVEAEMEKVATDLAADRIIVFQYHNGQSDLSGLPFVYSSATFVHVQNGINWREEWSRPVPLSSFTPLMRRMWASGAPKCVLRDQRDPDISPTALARMQARGIDASIICPIHTPAGHAVGMVAADYLHREQDRPPIGIAAVKLQATAARIHASLAEVMRR